MNADKSTFEDPHLKAACCCAWKGDCLPSEIRKRLMSGAWIFKPMSRPLAFWQRPLTGVAAAAAILLSVGAVSLEFTGTSADAAGPLKPQFASDLISRHDKCCARHSSHQVAGIPRADLPQLGEALNRSLHEPVLVANLPEDGWRFRGGAVCLVAKVPAAHLIFDHNGASVSVFSLPAGWSALPAGPFEEEVNDHAIAGFNSSNGSFLFVGSGDEAITPEHLAELRDRMETQIVNTTWNNPSDHAHVAELLH